MNSSLTELGGATAPAPTPQSQPTAQSFDPLSVPFLRAVAEADEPGFTATREDLSRPELAPAVQNYKALANVGLSLYGAKDGSFAVFNPEVFTGEEVKQFDAQGILSQVLPPIATLLEKANAGGGDKAGVESVTPPAAAASPTPTPAAAGPTPSVPTPVVRARARANALDTQAPTKKPQPGAGAISQGLGRPVV